MKIVKYFLLIKIISKYIIFLFWGFLVFFGIFEMSKFNILYEYIKQIFLSIHLIQKIESQIIVTFINYPKSLYFKTILKLAIIFK